MELQVHEVKGGYLSIRPRGDGTVEVRFHIIADHVAVLARREQLPVRIVRMDATLEVYFRWVMAQYGVRVL